MQCQSLGNLLQGHEQRLRKAETLKGQCSGGNVDMNSQPWSGRPVVQVRPVRKANQHISGFQEAESRRTYYKNRGIAQKAIAEKLNFGSCNVREVIAGLVYGLKKCVLDGCNVSARLKCVSAISRSLRKRGY